MIIVTRHPAAIQFVARELGLRVIERDGQILGLAPQSDDYPIDQILIVLDQATPDDVRGRVVYGNLPLHLAALANKVVVIEFTGSPPRGREYTLADMDAAGAVLRDYKVAIAPKEH